MTYVNLDPDPYLPAVFGGRPVFADRLPPVRPGVANPSRVLADLAACVTVASCTAGPMLRLRASVRS
jgi:hypothetical protein